MKAVNSEKAQQKAYALPMDEDQPPNGAEGNNDQHNESLMPIKEETSQRQSGKSIVTNDKNTEMVKSMR